MCIHGGCYAYDIVCGWVDLVVSGTERRQAGRGGVPIGSDAGPSGEHGYLEQTSAATHGD